MSLHQLPKTLRRQLKKPWGDIIPNEKITREEILSRVKGSSLIVSVGDATTETLISFGITPDIQIVDAQEGRVKRSQAGMGYKTEIRAHNPAGCLSEEALSAVSEALRVEKPVRIAIDGEEDLLAVPVIATYPPDTRVLYGQPGIGLVIVDEVSMAERASKILKEMGVDISKTMGRS